MKNVQIIDGADNCTYSIYSFADNEFRAIFPGYGQDVEFVEDAFVEDAIGKFGDEKLGKLLAPV